MEIILVRHAESECNRLGTHAGQKIDAGLSEEGIKQAEKLARRLKNEKIERIYSSDLKRANHTAEIINKFHNVKIIPDKRLREFDCGDLLPLKNKFKIFEEHRKKEAKRLGINPLEVKTPGGESEWDHIQRVSSFIEELENKKLKKVLIVGHGGTNKVFFGVIGHFPYERMYEIKQSNTGLSIIKKEGKKYKAHLINCTKHLE